VTLKNEMIYLFDDADQLLQQGEGKEEQCLDYLADIIGVADSTQTLWHFLEFMVLQPSHATWLQTTEWLSEVVRMAHPINLDEALAHFTSTDSPEFLSDPGDSSSLSGGGDGTGYFWGTVFSLVSAGRLSDAWTVLQLHSEVAESLRADTPHSHGHSHSQNPAAQLAHIFATHPTVLLSLQECDEELLGDPAFLRQQVGAWQAWGCSVRRLIADNSTLVVGIPPLMHLLRFFVGSDEQLQSGEAAPSSWQVIALHRLLFSPFESSHVRLSRQDVSRVLVDSIALGRKRTAGDESSMERQYTEVVTSLLNQELGAFLTFCATPPATAAVSGGEDEDEDDEGGGSMGLLRDVSVGMTLVNTMHVSALLRLTGDLSTAAGTAQGAFVVKSVVAGCSQLSSMQFPQEVRGVREGGRE
jgi:hypothetical protein